jgi:hypothetical protein
MPLVLNNTKAKMVTNDTTFSLEHHSTPWTDVMILKYFRREILRKIVLLKNLLVHAKILNIFYHNLCFQEKRHF